MCESDPVASWAIHLRVPDGICLMSNRLTIDGLLLILMCLSAILIIHLFRVMFGSRSLVVTHILLAVVCVSRGFMIIVDFSLSLSV